MWVTYCSSKFEERALEQQWRLTLPSSGHTTAGHDCLLRQGRWRRCVPLTSNVRAVGCRVNSMCLRSPPSLRRCAAREVPRAVHRVAYVPVAHSRALGASRERPLVAAFRSARGVGLAREVAVARVWLRSFCSLALRSTAEPGSGRAGTGFARAGAAGSLRNLASLSMRAQSLEAKASATLCPNPAVERTANGGARLLAPSPSAAPLSAAHLKR